METEQRLAGQIGTMLRKIEKANKKNRDENEDESLIGTLSCLYYKCSLFMDKQYLLYKMLKGPKKMIVFKEQNYDLRVDFIKNT